MRAALLSLVFASILTGSALAQAPMTATCKDGTTGTGNTARAACRGHGGVQAGGATAAVPPATPEATAGAPVVTPGAPANVPRNATSRTPAPGGGAGLVWVNSGTKAYHCFGDRYYGLTRRGSYMTEAAAKAQGAHGKACGGSPASPALPMAPAQ